MRVPRYQWISAKMKVWRPRQLKKSKSCGPVWSYQLNSTANSVHLDYFRGEWLNWCQKTFKSKGDQLRHQKTKLCRVSVPRYKNCQISKIHCLLCQNFQYNWIEDGEKNSKMKRWQKLIGLLT